MNTFKFLFLMGEVNLFDNIFPIEYGSFKNVFESVGLSFYYNNMFRKLKLQPILEIETQGNRELDVPTRKSFFDQYTIPQDLTNKEHKIVKLGRSNV